MALAYILYWAVQLNVNVPLMVAICDVESDLRHVIVMDGESHSYGPCQVKYIAAKDAGFTGQEYELTDPKVSVYWAVKYFKKQFKRYRGRKWHAVAAYNAGSARFKNKRFVNASYVSKVKKRYYKWRRKLRKLIR